jgi:hypothetical protein
MSVSGFSNSPIDFRDQSIQCNMQQFKQEFQQLGQDLHADNLSAAQADFVTLQQLGPRAFPLLLRRAAVPLPKRSSSCLRTCRRGISLPRSRTM